MTSVAGHESRAEAVLRTLMLAVFWCAVVALAAGLGLWTGNHGSPTGARLLIGGLVAILLMPLLRLAAALLSAFADRDWLLVAAILAVIAILTALTLRDAAKGSFVE